MKLKKLLSCLLALSLTVCASGFVASAADTVVFSDSFERESESGFYVSNPVLRSYGENLFTNGDFSSDLISSGSGVYIDKAYNSPKKFVITDGALEILPADSKVATDYTINIYIPIDYMTGGNIYELEMYVKSDSAYPIKMNLNQTHLGQSKKTYYGVDYLYDNGNRLMSAVAAPEFERVVTRFSIEKTPTQEETIGGVDLPTHIQLQVGIDWDFDGRTATTDSLYIDDIKLRRVTNAAPSTSAVQVGMPSYSDANLAGKNVQAIMDVMNATDNAKDITLITAYYNADTSLNNILNVYKTSVPGNSTATQRIESEVFTVPADLSGGDIKVFAWDSTSSLIPYLEKTDSEYVGYAVKESASDHSNLNKNVDGSDVWRYEDNFAAIAGGAISSFTEELDTATAKSGIASLCLPTVAGNAPSMVYTTVPVKPDTTYRLEFYVMPTYLDSFTFYVSGACGNTPNTKTYAMTGTLNSKFKWAGNLTGSTATEEVVVTSKQTNQGARYYGPISGAITGWNKVTYTFTTPPADAKANDGVYSVTGTVGEEGSYWTTFGSNVGIVFGHGPQSYANATTPKSREYAAWIDDVVLYEVAE